MTSAAESSQIHVPDKTAERLGDKAEMQQLIQDVTLAVEILPSRFRGELWTHPEFSTLIELVMDYGRRPIARFPTGDFPLSEAFIDFKDLDSAIKSVGEFGDDNRTGIEGTLHRVSCMRDRHDRIYGLTIRIGRAVTTETAGLVVDPLAKGLSVLLLGPPGVGKTTAIRSFCRLLSDDLRKRVVIVDTSNEIAGHGLIPHPAVGSSRRMQLKHRADQHHIMVEAVQNHMPEVIVIDEIGKKEECQAAKAISQRGVQLLATTHARTLEDVIKDPVLRELVGGISNVIIGDGRASQTKSNKKTVPERANASSFNVIVEMTDRTQWRIHYDADSAVDAILAGHSPSAEIRYLDEEGNMFVTDEFQGTGVFIPQQNHVNMRKPLVKSEPTNDKTNTTQPLLHKTEETKHEELAFEATEGPSNLQSNTISAPPTLTPETKSSPIDFLLEVLALSPNIAEPESIANEPLNTSNKDAILEAERILTASSDHEVLQAEGNASRDDLRNCYKSVFQKIEGSKNEPAILKVARRRLYFAYSTLLCFNTNKESNTNTETKISRESNINTETKISKESNTGNDPRYIEAARIMSASSNLEVLQAKDGASTTELKECFSKVMRRVSKMSNEDELVKKSRVRVQEAYNKLLPSISTTKTISVSNPRLKEAERIINASSDLEILQVNAGASKKELTAALNAVNKKIVKTEDEDENIKKARRLVLEAHLRLLPPKNKKKEKKKNAVVGKTNTNTTHTLTQSEADVGKKTKKKKDSSTKTTTGGTSGAISVEQWVTDSWN